MAAQVLSRLILLLSLSGLAGTASAVSTPTCTAGTPVQILSTTTGGANTYYVDAVNTSTPSTLTVDMNSVVASPGIYDEGAGPNGRFIVDMQWSWSNGNPAASSGRSTMELLINGVVYATMTTTNGSGTTATLAATNGATLGPSSATSLSIPVNTSGAANTATGTDAYVLLPTAVTSISTARIRFTAYKTTTAPTTSDDLGYTSSVYACPPYLTQAKTSNGPWFPGQSGASYTLTTTNVGSSTSAAVTVTDTLPGGVTASSGSGSGWTWTVSGQTVTATTAAIASGASSSFTLPVTVTTAAPLGTNSVTNYAAVSGGGDTRAAPTPGASCATDNCARVSTTVYLSADLSVTKTGPSTAVAGTQITYVLTLGNAGPNAANGATYSDNVPNNLTGVSAVCINPGAGVSGCTATVGSGNNVTGSVATFPSGGSVQVQITGTIPAGATATLTNSASIAAPNANVVDPTSANNTSSTVSTTLTRTADISLSKTDSLTGVTAGQAVTYQIVLRNAGPSTTTVNFVDTSFSGVTLSNWTCAVTAGTASCPASLPASGGYSNSLLNLPAGSTLTFSVTGTVTATSGTVSNAASASVPANVTDPSGAGNNAATDTDTVLVPALNLTKAVSSAFIRVSADPTDQGAATLPASTLTPSQLTYTLIVTGAGTAPAANTVIRDSLPAGMLYSSATIAFSTGGGGYTAPVAATNTGSGQDLVFSAGTLNVTEPGQSARIVITVTGALSANTNQAALLNTATATATGVSTVTSNQVRTDVVYSRLFKQVHNLGSAPAAAIPQVAPAWSSTSGGLPGEILEYCIDFRNHGTVTLSSFSVADGVPANTTYVAGSAALLRGSMQAPGTSWVNIPVTTPAASVGFDGTTVTASNLVVPPGETGTMCFRVRIS